MKGARPAAGGRLALLGIGKGKEFGRGGGQRMAVR